MIVILCKRVIFSKSLLSWNLGGQQNVPRPFFSNSSSKIRVTKYFSNFFLLELTRFIIKKNFLDYSSLSINSPNSPLKMSFFQKIKKKHLLKNCPKVSLHNKKSNLKQKKIKTHRQKKGLGILLLVLFLTTRINFMKIGHDLEFFMEKNVRSRFLDIFGVVNFSNSKFSPRSVCMVWDPNF
jgi:ribosomal protein S8